MKKRGNLFVVSGFSGSGKGTLMQWFRQQENYVLSISCTSRKPREGEIDGVDYFFISHEEFLARVQENYFLEHAIYVDKAYGTPRDYVEKNLSDGKDVILEIEMQGAMQVRENDPDAILIFITPPSAAELRRRLVGRGTETPEQIEKRLARAVEEREYMDHYDYIVVNDDLETSIQELHQLMQSTHHMTKCNRELIEAMKQDLLAQSSEEN